jgi:hypothetical protein
MKLAWMPSKRKIERREAPVGSGSTGGGTCAWRMAISNGPLKTNSERCLPTSPVTLCDSSSSLFGR